MNVRLLGLVLVALIAAGGAIFGAGRMRIAHSAPEEPGA